MNPIGMIKVEYGGIVKIVYIPITIPDVINITPLCLEIQ